MPWKNESSRCQNNTALGRNDSVGTGLMISRLRDKGATFLLFLAFVRMPLPLTEGPEGQGSF